MDSGAGFPVSHPVLRGSACRLDVQRGRIYSQGASDAPTANFVDIFAVSAFAQAPPTAAKQAPAGPPKPAPRLADGRIDFSGLWRPADIFLIEDISLGLKPGEAIPLTRSGPRKS